MLYEKASAEVIRFERGAAFMTASPDYSTATSALESVCGVFSGSPNNFSCGSFMGFSADNPPPHNKYQVVVGNDVYEYVFEYTGNHWKKAN